MAAIRRPGADTPRDGGERPEPAAPRRHERLVGCLGLALVAVLFAAPLFIGLGRTDLENDEGIYSFAVDEILERGDWLNPSLSPDRDTVFLEKPPLKFWIVAAPIAAGLLPHDELGLRVPDALMGAIAFLYVFAIGRRLAGPVCGAAAVMMLFVFEPLIFVHGLRNNNMEAPLFLCYCGGVYHWLAWTSADDRRRRLAHAVGVALCFYLGFMTKFVAAFFLPLVVGAATLARGPLRSRLREDWRLAAAGGALFLVLAAPWFVYQEATRPGALWQVMVGEHVVTRFTASLDPSHLQPWHHYVREIARELGRNGSVWLVALGLVVAVGRVSRRRSIEADVVLLWLVLPLGLMSLGSSKLMHYAYPFLPPAALAGGLGLAWLVRSAGRVATVVVGRRAAAGFLPGPVPRRLLYAVAGLAAAVAAATAIWGPFKWTIDEEVVIRSSRLVRPLTVVVLAVLVAGRTVPVKRAATLALVLTLLPFGSYRETLARLPVEKHPIRSSRDCLLAARARELGAGRPVDPLVAVGEQEWFQHSYFYYLRHLGWARTDAADDAVLLEAFTPSARPRPVLMSDSQLRLFKARQGVTFPTMAVLRMETALLLMPGPFAVCSPTVRE